MHLRPATIKDCADLVILDDIATHGMGSWIWAHMAAQSGQQSGLQLARTYVMGDELGMGYRSATIAEIDGRVAGAVTACLLDDLETHSSGAAVERVIAPMMELLAEALGTWYINTLAVYSEFQGNGVGAALFEHGAQAAREAGAREIGLVVEDDNPAIRLYERFGFQARARRPFAPFETSTKRDGDWVLMVRPVGAASEHGESNG